MNILNKILRRQPPIAATPNDGYMTVMELGEAMMAIIAEMKPGQAHAIKHRDGRRFAVMDLEDYLHILDAAGMKAVNAKTKETIV